MSIYLFLFPPFKTSQGYHDMHPPTFVINEFWSSFNYFERPMSESLVVPSKLIKMLFGLRSQWTRFIECKKWRPSAAPQSKVIKHCLLEIFLNFFFKTSAIFCYERFGSIWYFDPPEFEELPFSVLDSELEGRPWSCLAILIKSSKFPAHSSIAM